MEMASCDCLEHWVLGFGKMATGDCLEHWLLVSAMEILLHHDEILLHHDQILRHGHGEILLHHDEILLHGEIAMATSAVRTMDRAAAFSQTSESCWHLFDHDLAHSACSARCDLSL